MFAAPMLLAAMFSTKHELLLSMYLGTMIGCIRIQPERKQLLCDNLLPRVLRVPITCLEEHGCQDGIDWVLHLHADIDH
jgi:hypothetical protein